MKITGKTHKQTKNPKINHFGTLELTKIEIEMKTIHPRETTKLL